MTASVMPGARGRWSHLVAAVVALAFTCSAVHEVVPVDSDHLVVLFALVVGSAAVSTLSGGRQHAVATLTAVTLVSQPALHALAEAAVGHDALGLAHQGYAGLALLVAHVAFASASVCGLNAMRTLSLRVAASLRRWTRTLLRWALVESTPVDLVGALSAADPGLPHAELDRAARPPRRGPPS